MFSRDYWLLSWSNQNAYILEILKWLWEYNHTFKSKSEWKIKFWHARILNFNHPNNAILEVGINFDKSLYFLEFEVLLFPRLGSVIFNTGRKTFKTRDSQVYFAFINLFLCLCTHSHSNLIFYTKFWKIIKFSKYGALTY